MEKIGQSVPAYLKFETGKMQKDSRQAVFFFALEEGSDSGIFCKANGIEWKISAQN
jgi:hypothetical protein